MNKKTTDQALLPTSDSQRYLTLDMIRGLALFGILFVNLTWFTGFAVIHGNGGAFRWTREIDETVYWWIYFLIDGKFWTIFAILFGYGIGLYFEKSQHLSILLRRFAVLLLIGLLHGMAMWFGDIIALYAVSGFFTILFCKCSNRCLLIGAIAFLCLPLLHSALWLWIQYQFVTPEVTPSHPPHGPYHYLNSFENGNLGQVIGTNWHFFVQRWFLALYEGRFYKLLGLFLLGMFFVKSQLLFPRNKDSRELVGLVIFCGFVGLILNFLMAHEELSKEANNSFATLYYKYSLKTIGGPLLGIAYTALFALALPSIGRNLIGKSLAAVGRMSLTNYIGQTAICMLLFYGFGFGLWGNFGITWALLILAGICLLQSAYSLLWLSRFKYGPLEWLARTIIYWKRIPIEQAQE